MTRVRSTPHAPTQPRALDAADPFARAIRASWRRLTGGLRVRDHERRTLVACSGGADSSALALALAGVGHNAVVIAHVVHDMRPEHEALADRDAVRSLADSLGVAFVEETIAIAEMPGNTEANARERRLEALARIGKSTGASFIATGHHADDQLETVLMRLVRGAGPAGLAGIHESRPFEGGTLIRPLLTQTHRACEDACHRAGWAWREDATNTDESRLRAAIRARVAPELNALSPRLPERIARTCRLMHGASELVEAQARDLADDAERRAGAARWGREHLAECPSIVVGQLVREELAARGVGPDAISGARLDDLLEAVADPRDGVREFPFDGVRVVVRGAAVEILDASKEAGDD